MELNEIDDKFLLQEGRLGDLIIVGILVKRIIKPIEKSKAFQLGLIDKKGKLIRKPKTKEEKNAYTILDKFVFKIKRLLGTKATSLITFLLLLTDVEYEKEYNLLMENYERARRQ